MQMPLSAISGAMQCAGIFSPHRLSGGHTCTLWIMWGGFWILNIYSFGIRGPEGVACLSLKMNWSWSLVPKASLVPRSCVWGAQLRSGLSMVTGQPCCSKQPLSNLLMKQSTPLCAVPHPTGLSFFVVVLFFLHLNLGHNWILKEKWKGKCLWVCASVCECVWGISTVCSCCSVCGYCGEHVCSTCIVYIREFCVVCVGTVYVYVYVCVVCMAVVYMYVVYMSVVYVYGVYWYVHSMWSICVLW
jgi:hypothetical protein